MSNYVRYPETAVDIEGSTVQTGYGEITARLAGICSGRGRTVISVECYPGVSQEELLEGLQTLPIRRIFHSDDLAFEPDTMDALLEQDLTEDPVFGMMTVRRLEDYFYEEKIRDAQKAIAEIDQGVILVYGVGASLIHPGDVGILADITRWEIQLRYRRGMNNWRTAITHGSKSWKYKRGYFGEWRWADKVKQDILPTVDYYLDMTVEGSPVMMEGDAYRRALEQVSGAPFRMVPYFDPGVWGGDWMKTRFGLEDNGSNYAWSFDGVPEENSLLFNIGGKRLQTPALNLVYMQPGRLLGERVHARFGREFPIRFDMLDTIHGQNLSLQVHPLTEYIQEHFNMRYTQDESYYILDTQGEETCVWLGVRTGVDQEAMARELREAQQGRQPFAADRYVNQIPVRKHDHILIPAGTVHCSGSGTMVLEISATPYIFTFKMWDWDRVDLDGKPRPVHIEEALSNIQWNRDTEWVKENLVNAVTPVYADENCQIERTGLHELEFIDTYRVTTDSQAHIRRNGSVHMMNLVEGSSAEILSPTNAFKPFELHYAETCIIPEAAGEYSISSTGGASIKVILACVR